MPDINLPTPKQISDSIHQHSVKTIKGKVSWEQEQYGSCRDSFKAGIDYILNYINTQTK